MTWFRVDDTFTTHPKVRSIPRAQRLAAKGLWMSCGAWSAQQLTDGVITGDAVEDEGGDHVLAKLLVEAGLWHTEGHDCPRCPQPPIGGYVFHDWPVYQRTREQVLAARRATAERVTRFRERKAAQIRNGVTNGVTDTAVTALPTALVTPPPKVKRQTQSKTKTAPTEQVPRGTGEQDALDLGPGATPATSGDVNAGTVVAAWVDACTRNGVTPSTAQRAQVGRMARELLINNDPRLVLEAATVAGTKGFASIDRELTALNGRTPSRARGTMAPEGHPTVPTRIRTLQASIAALEQRRAQADPATKEITQ